MSDITMQNDKLLIELNLHGAELRRIQNLQTGKDLLWNADPSFWNRSSPVLFPFVGQVRDKFFTYEGVQYPMGQHGFARDMDFVLTSQTEDTIWFKLESNEESMAKYPLPFILEIGYELKDNAVKVLWKVTNPAEKTLYFSIGAHPAFMCPINEGEKQSDCAFLLKDQKGQIVNTFINTIFGQNGLVSLDKEERTTEDGVMILKDGFFDNDALVIEDSQIGEVAILGKDGRPYITVTFTSPVVGLWSPPKKHAPFVCIEPWYGRSDDMEFVGELKDRKWGNCLVQNEVFEGSYTIKIGE